MRNASSSERESKLAELRRIARQRGGALLSQTYVNNREPLLWRCDAGHMWQAAAGHVKPGRHRPGSWCPNCPRRSKGKPAVLSIEEMQELARSRGGECMSTSYVNGLTKLKWRCAGGHEWKARPAMVKYGTWCPVCAGTRKLDLKLLRQEARSCGGKLISREYANGESPLLWECAAGHRWKATAAKIRSGRWCPSCGGTAPLSIEEMNALARARGGRCLSKRYVNSKTPLKWQCRNGHVWHATPGMIKPSGPSRRATWCPECARAPLYTVDDMRKLAAQRGGKCLSQVYVNHETLMRWRCARGHTWEAKPRQIRPYSERAPGSWCPTCAAEASRLSIEQMQAVARERGGECLSAEYIDSRTALRWRCSEGHEWMARPNHVRAHGRRQQGSWCPRCAGRRS